MSRILQQMNSATVPMARGAAPVRQVSNYFFLLTTMMKLGLQLIWERQHGLKYFDGIMDTTQGREMYDDIVRCVMRPEEEDSRHFQPEEIDAIAEKLATRGMKTQDAAIFLKTVIESRIESEALEGDGDTHQPPLGWIVPKPDMGDVIEFSET